MRRVADPYRVNNHKPLPKPRADNIHPYTVQYTLAAVFLRVNKIRPAVYHLQLFCKSLFINLYTQQKSRQISLSGLFCFMNIPLKGSAIFSVHSGASDCVEEPLYLAV